MIVDVLQHGEQVHQALCPKPAEAQDALDRHLAKVLGPFVKPRRHQAIERSHLQIEVGELDPPGDRRESQFGDGHRYPGGASHRSHDNLGQGAARLVVEPVPRRFVQITEQQDVVSTGQVFRRDRILEQLAQRGGRKAMAAAGIPSSAHHRYGWKGLLSDVLR